MRRLHTCLVILLISISGAFAQNPVIFTISPDEVTADPGDTIILDLSVRNYTDYISMGLQINWDQSIMQFVELTDINGDDFDRLGPGVSGANGTENSVVLAWLHPTLGATSVPDGTVIFKMKFVALGGGAFTTSFSGIEVIDADSNLADTDTENSMITVTGDPVDTGNMDPIGIMAGSGSTMVGVQTCVPVSVNGFEEMESFQLTMEYDPTILTFDVVQNLNLAGLSDDSFGTPNDGLDAGTLTVAWANMSGSATGVSVDDGTQIFQLCFSGAAAGSSDISFSSSEITSEAQRADVGEVNITASEGSITVTEDNTGGGNTDDFILSVPDLNANNGDRVCLPITTTNFTDIIAMQYVMQWDPSILEFAEVINVSPNFTGFNPQDGALNITYGESDDGILRLLWDDATFSGASLADGETLYEVCFDVIGSQGQQSDFTFESPVEVINIIPDTGSNEEVPFNSDAGSVTVDSGGGGGGGGNTGSCESDCDANSTPLCMSSEVGDIGTEVCVQVNAQNFNDIVSMQYSLTFDPADLEFTELRIIEGVLQGFIEEASFNLAETANGIISTLWEEPTLAMINLDDGAEIYSICFTVLTEGVHTIEFSDNPVIIEVTDGNMVLPFNGGNGCVSTPVDNACTPISITENNITDAGCSGTSGSIDITISGGQGNYTIAWADGSADEDRTNLAPGDYTVSITSECTQSDTQTMTFTIGEGGAMLQVNVQATRAVTCFGDNTGAIEITVSGGSENYTYTWSDNLPNQANQADLAAGEYMVTIDDGAGCMNVQTITVDGPTTAISVTPTVTDVSCNEQGTIDLTVMGGTGSYTAMWSDDEMITTTNRTDLSMGDYNVTILDANNCSFIVEDAISIATAADAISISEMITNISGVDGIGAIDITVGTSVDNKTFVWTGPEAFTTTTEDISDLMTGGEYCVMITDTITNCMAEACFIVSMPLSIIGEVQVSCDGQNTGGVILTVTGGAPDYTYIWMDSEGNSLPSTKDLLDVGAGTYIVEIEDAEGAGQQLTFEVLASPLIVVNPTLQAETGCRSNNNGMIDLGVTGGTPGFSYSWTSALPLPDTNVVMGLDTGLYTVVITDTVGCTRTEEYRIDFEATAPGLESIEIRNLDCSNTDSLGGGFSFRIINGNPFYTVRINNNIDVDETFTFTDDCPLFDVNELSAGTYDITITDADERVTTEQITIDAPAAFSVTPSLFSNTNPNDCNGRIVLAPIGGSGNYTYQWNNSDTTAIRENLCAGEHIVTVTDANGCFVTDTILITLFAADNIVTPANCPEDDSTGKAELLLSGGIAPFTYAWSTIDDPDNILSMDSTLIDINTGEYIVEITENAGAGVILRDTITIGSASELSVASTFPVNYAGFGVSCVGATDAIIAAIASNSSGYQYTWLQDNMVLSTTDTLRNVGVGTYTIEVVDSFGCSISQEVIVAAPTELTIINKDVLDLTCAGDNNGEAAIIVEGGILLPTGGYTYEWSHASNVTTERATGLRDTIYSITITDGNGCTVMDTVGITGPEPIIITTESQAVSGATSGFVQATVTGGTPPYRYQWLRQEFGQTPSEIPGETKSILEDIDTEATYILEVEDINRCTASISEELFDLSNCLTYRAILTPNNDDRNDILEIRCLRAYSDNRLEVYSRWGQLVYAEDNYDNTWEGVDMDGNQLPEGAYFFVLQYTDENGQMLQEQGAISILLE